ncbi:MAG: hypothetical protein A3F16_02215 [Deltaproteobacteria bacterium RIFCSPHIGHO2_12_FULL_43_9]|nr:MAG: hypothetical protein A3F16_02215 [Deltaproteobacteria bacterium RIFCSPHIGHO2_12_FULL_43_9]
MPFWFKRKKSKTDYFTPGVRTDLAPSRWRSHHFGLQESRWKSLGNKKFWITGAGTGYGRAISIALACANAEIFLTGRREEKLRQTVSEMKTLGIVEPHCHILHCDITDATQVRGAVKKINEGTDSLHGLVHCAALVTKNHNKPLQNESFETWENLIRTNVTAPWYLTREIFPHMIRGNSARVIFFSSGAGWASTPGFGPYNVSKAALNTLSASLAAELLETYPGQDIQINVLEPGEARTEMNQGSDISPFAVANMTLLLLSSPPNGPNGMFFHRDGRELCWGQTSQKF